MAWMMRQRVPTASLQLMKNKEKVASIPDGRSAIQRGLDRLSEVGLFSLEERMLKEILSVCINI